MPDSSVGTGDIGGRQLFKPWIGARFGDGNNFFGCRLLVIGESYYLASDAEGTPDFASKIMELVKKGWKNRFYTGLLYVLTGKLPRDLNDVCIEAVLDSLAFYNFVQSTKLRAARQQPTHEDWMRSATFFPGVLTELQPNKILVCGRRLSWIINRLLKVPPQASQAYQINYSPQGTPAWAATITHPSSSRFRRDDARDSFVALRCVG